MIIVKEFQSRGMKHIQYDCADFEEIKKRFSWKLSDETIKKLCNYLKENEKIIDAIDCYDCQSGWEGTKFKIGDIDLSGNGYCLSDSSVLQFLNGVKG